jgi:three-Cys-motif partner protein
MNSPETQVADDSLICPEVGSWAEEKYRIVSLYQELFATGMKDKWEKRVYLDLYSGAGCNRVRGTNRILHGAALAALLVKHPFDKYIFCEKDPERLSALRTRALRIASFLDIEYIPGDCDLNVHRICASIPPHSSTQKVLSLCFVDPFDFGINFETIKKLSAYFMDFLVLLAVGMDANRNYDHYVDGESTKIDVALGNTEWRERWQSYVHRSDFRTFLAAEFSRSMEKLDYLAQPIYQMKHVRSDDKNLPLYYVALFSRSKVAYDFWKDVLKYSTNQRSFGFEGES